VHVTVFIVLAYVAFHLGAGHAHHRHRKAQGLNPSIYWSLARGPYAAIRIPGTRFRLGHPL